MNRSAILLCVALCFVAAAHAKGNKPSGRPGGRPGGRPDKPGKICRNKLGWIVIEEENGNVNLDTLAVLSNDASTEGAKIAVEKGCVFVSTELQKACEQILPGGTTPVYQYQAKVQMECPNEREPGTTKTKNAKFARNYPRPEAPAPAPV